MEQAELQVHETRYKLHPRIVATSGDHIERDTRPLAKAFRDYVHIVWGNEQVGWP
jgi:predicted phosphodiesterase